MASARVPHASASSSSPRADVREDTADLTPSVVVVEPLGESFGLAEVLSKPPAFTELAQHRTQLEAEIAALLQREPALRQRLEEMQPLLEGFDSLEVGRPRACKLTRPAPILDRFACKAGLGEMMGDNLGQGFGHRREPLDQHLGNAGMQLPPPSLEQGGVGGVLYQRMLE